MLVVEVCLQMLLDSCDESCSLGGGWLLIPPEENRESEGVGKSL